MISQREQVKSARTIVEQYEFCLVHKLSNRITELKSDLLKIIKGQRHSEFRVDAVKRIQEIGKSKVGHPLLYQINYFESFQPGYYGPKVQVLVPETAIRLIAEDLGGIPLDMAKNVMNDSVELGFYVHKDSYTVILLIQCIVIMFNRCIIFHQNIFSLLHYFQIHQVNN
ncbi:unnamed protein product [Rhizophagus irregularis]|nr:unnamed protein product [Rhizophagus irregularis]